MSINETCGGVKGGPGLKIGLIDVDGVLIVPPCYIEPSLRSVCSEKVCADCRREFWMQEVE